MTVVCYTKKNKTPFLIDDEDYEFVLKHTWYCDNYGYVASWIDGKSQRLHRLLTNAPNGLVTDHADGNVRNNQKFNLRVCSYSQNSYNRKPRNGVSSKYKGVWWHEKYQRWQAQIKLNGKKKYIGLFQTEDGAAKAYNEVALKYYGDFAKLNVIT